MPDTDPMRVTVLVNGQREEVRTERDTALLYVLRNHLGLTGTRFGCGLGLCGACLVLIDGRPAYSCDTPMWAVENRDVTTVEGLGVSGRPHPAAQAIIDGQAAQCGYCISGVVISAAGLLAVNDDPSEDEVRAALDGNLCRCGAHNRIVRAVLAAASSLRSLAPRPRFVHDMALDEMLYGRVIRPPSRGATLLDVLTESARALPGVVTVVRDGSFLGVITEREEVALRAADLLRADAKWHEAPTLPDEDDLSAFLTSAPAETRVLAESPPPSSAAPTPAARSHEATYHRPYLAHAAMGPSTATALASTAPAGDEAGVRLKVWTHSQGALLATLVV